MLKIKIFKIILVIVAVLLGLTIASNLGGFNLLDFIGNLLGFGSNLGGGTTQVGQTEIIPVFEITSLRMDDLNNVSWRKIEVMDPLRWNIGTITVLVEYDSHVTIGKRNPDTIRIERIGNQVFVDKSSIVIEILDAWVTNYRHINTSTSNAFLQSDRFVTPDKIFQMQTNHEAELIERIMISNQSVLLLAKENFMLNYELLCVSMGLQVEWAENEEEFDRFVRAAMGMPVYDR